MIARVGGGAKTNPKVGGSFFFWHFKATPVAYGGSQVRGGLGAAATGLHHSHNKARSELCLEPTPQLRQHQILNPLREATDGTC